MLPLPDGTLTDWSLCVLLVPMYAVAPLAEHISLGI